MKDLINYSDFSKLDLRVGEVVNVEEVEGSEKLLKLTVDFGAEIGEKIIYSGIKKWYTAASLQNKKFIFLVNIEPKIFKIGDQTLESNGMILGAGEEEAALCILDKDLTNGSTVR